MNQQEILKKIGGIIAELKDQYTYLQAAESSFNDLELELFMANAHFLTDHIAILQKINHQFIPAQLPAAEPVIQLTETSAKIETPDYFDEQDLVQAEQELLKLNFIGPEITESRLDVQQPVQEKIIILPEVMPVVQSAVDASFTNEKSSSEQVAQPETEVHTSFTDQKTTTEADTQEELAFCKRII
ncbi:MAG: hypothetical protein EOP42_20465 [Sphingobacteriaceae bacterium]|nr:MAG: hypothetical protein EOP42_20465 [Sphingobacteriaceae bacterium]